MRRASDREAARARRTAGGAGRDRDGVLSNATETSAVVKAVQDLGGASIDGVTTKRIARHLGVSVETVAAQLAHAKYQRKVANTEGKWRLA